MVLPVGEHAAAAFRIVAVERFHDTSFVAGSGIGACGLPAAGAGLRHHVLILSTVQVLLHMGDDHVAFGYQDAASGVQFKVLDEGQVMEARPGYLTAVDLHRVRQSDRREIAAASCLFQSGQCPQSLVYMLLKSTEISFTSYHMPVQKTTCFSHCRQDKC